MRNFFKTKQFKYQLISFRSIRKQGVEETESVLTQFDKYPIQLIEAERRLTHEATKLKAKYTIAYADCFAAALALKLKGFACYR